MDSLPSEERIQEHAAEMVGYMRSLYPMRFYHGEKWWKLHAAAAVLRLADMADATLAHMPARRDLDAMAALRNLYEMVVTLAWVLIEPEKRKEQWEGEALIEQLKLHHDLATFGETLLQPREVAAAKAATGMPPLIQRARDCDKHWASRVEGLYAPGHLLSFSGQYNLIYRHGSRSTHASVASLVPYVTYEEHRSRLVVAPPAPFDETFPYALVSPLLASALTVLATEVKWIDVDKVREINDRATESG